MPLHCLIVDDNDHFLRAARRLLERQGMAVVGIPSTGAEALVRFDECRPDVTLVDVQLGEECGLDVARRLVGRAKGTSEVILISAYPESDFADILVRYPSIGFLSKSDLSAEAIRDILTKRATRDRG
ncbi:response regulator [Nonomuraea sp. B12E4]|uniref:response regulator n=1 Tax=Nonomuraea sp. B12E4 TaxID=3153564 RepID=UPI00325F17E2